MGIFTNNPVLEREVRGRLHLRRKGNVKANLWIARVLGLIVAYYYARGLLGIWHGSTQDAREFWPLLVFGALTLIVLLAPALTATAITQEREQQTWENLTTTQLSASEVLLGKWLGRQLVPWLLIAILLPFMVVSVSRAGMGAPLLLLTLAFLLMTTGCYSALGLLCSFQARRTMTATASALSLSALLCIGTVIINGVYDLLVFQGNTSQETAILWANPFYVLNRISSFSSGGPGVSSTPFEAVQAVPAVLSYFTLTIGVTTLALSFMVRRYRHAVRERS